MSNKYQVELINDDCILIYKRSEKKQIYRITYPALKSWSKSECENLIKNRFIVYILTSYNTNGKNYIYVGKSKNGIYGRPKQHEDKFQPDTCYVLTEEPQRTFFNDGTIQYMEHQINLKVNETHAFVNTTEATNTGTANSEDEDSCNDYLSEAYKMLNILGLDLNVKLQSGQSEKDADAKKPRAKKVKQKKVPPLTEKELKLPLTQLVPTAMRKLEKIGYQFTDEQMKKFMDPQYNYELFGKRTKYPFMKEYDPNDPKCAYFYGNIRFRKEPYTFNGKQYLVSKEWFDREHERKGFVNWYNSL